MDAVGEDALLDLLNTTPVVDGTPLDHLADDAAARRWAREHGGDDTGPAGLRAARDLLQAVARGDRPPSALEPLLDGVRLRPDAHAGGLDWHLDTPPGRRLPAELVLAWGRLARDLPGRLRPCANSECRLFLLDRSRAGTARWCSMRTCGNRLKARRHQQRRQDPPA
jgi:predicted RNA-binding Zn ribbon-like protein